MANGNDFLFDNNSKKANIRTYGKFCSLFEAEVTKLRDVDANYNEVNMLNMILCLSRVFIWQSDEIHDGWYQLQEKGREEASVIILGRIASFVDRQQLGELVSQDDWSWFSTQEKNTTEPKVILNATKSCD